MPIAHICHTCGHDLSRLHAGPDPHYGLLLITCPNCDTTHARRQHPMIAALRSVQRIDAVTLHLAAQLLGIGIFGGLTYLGMGLAGSLVLYDLPSLEHPAPAIVIATLMLLIVPIVQGAWLTAAFAHFPTGQTWFGWIKFISAGWILGSLCYIFFPDGYIGLGTDVGYWDIASVRKMEAVIVSFGAFAYLAWVMLVGLGGIPIGRALGKAAAVLRSWRWRARRRSRRKAYLSS